MHPDGVLNISPEIFWIRPLREDVLLDAGGNQTPIVLLRDLELQVLCFHRLMRIVGGDATISSFHLSWNF